MYALLSTIDLASAGWGFVGSIVYATFQIRARLCAGEEDPTPADRRQAWAEFVTAPITGTAIAAALSGSLARSFPALNAAGLAFVIGLASNPLWPVIKSVIEGAAVRQAIADALVKIAAQIAPGGGKPS